jgi:hypothetical protein
MTDYRGYSQFAETIGGGLGAVIASAAGLIGAGFYGEAVVQGAALIGRQEDTLTKKRTYQAKCVEVVSDWEELKNGTDLNKDLYLFLRPLALAGKICFQNKFNEDRYSCIPFEEAISRSVDSAGERVVVCVGRGKEKEKFGVANIAFDDPLWWTNIEKFFRCSIAIMSMPGCTPGCLQESAFIRHTPQLLEKTVFVIPPLSCYEGSSLLYNDKPVGIKDYFAAVRRTHEAIGIELPEAEDESGLFFTINKASGRPERQLKWQELELTKVVHKSFWRSTRKTTIMPTLTANRIRAALQLTSVDAASK